MQQIISVTDRTAQIVRQTSFDWYLKTLVKGKRQSAFIVVKNLVFDTQSNSHSLVVVAVVHRKLPVFNCRML